MPSYREDELLPGTDILVRDDQNTFKPKYRKKRLMPLLHLFLINRFKSDSLHYLTPMDDSEKQTQAMKESGIFSDITNEIGQIIVARVQKSEVWKYLDGEEMLSKLIRK